jgi:hypothetical protein
VIRSLGQQLLAGAFGLFRLVSAVALLALPALAGTGTPIAGATDPAFVAARAAWLADDEAAALAALAGLAQSGNAAARLLLGLIDRFPELQGPWLSKLPRADRLALMRIPGGLSGQSWLASADTPLAAAWVELMRVEAGPETGATFAALGEARAARVALTMLAAREHPALRNDWYDWMDPELAFVVWPRASDALRARLDTAIAPDHPQRGLMGWPAPEAGWSDWLAQSPVAAPFRALCAAECPDSQAACRSAAHAALGSQVAATTLGSPVEALIAQDEFLAAPRGRAAVLRRILLAADARGRPALIARATEADACLGNRLAAEADRYRTIRDGAESAVD